MTLQAALSSGWWNSSGLHNTDDMLFSPDGSVFAQFADGTIQAPVTAYCLCNQTGKFVFGFSFTENAGYTNTGVITGGPVAAPHSSANAILVNNLGNVTLGGSIVFDLPAATNTPFLAIDTTRGVFYASPDALNWYDNTGSARTTGQVAAGVGGYSYGSLVGPWDALFEFYNAGGNAKLIPIALFPNPAPSGFSDLTASLSTNILPAEPGGMVEVAWENPQGMDGPLEWSPDGSSWTVCGGPNTGTSGIATCGTATSTLGMTAQYYFRDSGNINAQAIPQNLLVANKPSGAGSLVGSASYNIVAGSQPSAVIEFAGGDYNKLYFIACLMNTNLDGLTFTIENSAADTEWALSFGVFGGAPSIGFGDLNGNPRSSGAASANGTNSLVVGTLDASSTVDGSAYGSIVLKNIGTDGTTTYADSAWPFGTLSAAIFHRGVLTDASGSVNTLFGAQLSIAFYAPALVEELSLESATGTVGGTLSVGGFYVNGPPDGINISIDDGAEYSASSNFTYTATGTTTSGTWSASGGVLSAGNIPVMVQDAGDESVVSNTITMHLLSPGASVFVSMLA
jgi:hypothetical protein